MSHSNGRWYVEGHYVKVLKPEREFLNEGAPETICEMQSSVSPEETQANQRLITVSPEMLTELQQAEKVIRHAAQESVRRVKAEIVGGWIYHANKIRDLIARAKGGAA